MCHARRSQAIVHLVGEHFDTLEEAQESYEKKMESKETHGITKTKRKLKSKEKQPRRKKEPAPTRNVEGPNDDAVREGAGFKPDSRSIRFYGHSTEAEIKRTSGALSKVLHSDGSKVRIADRHASATGVPYIARRGDEYAYGRSSMRIESDYYKSSDLRSVVREAGKREGYDRSRI